MNDAIAALHLREAVRNAFAPPRPAPPVPGRPPLRRMHFNEGAWPPSPKVAAAVIAALEGINRYSDSYGGRLTELVAARNRVAVERVFVGSGSGELISLASIAFLEPGWNAVVATPSFPRLASFARIAGAAVKAVPLRPDGGNDIEAMLAAIDALTRLVWIATPNNPTGAASSAPELRHLAERAPPGLVLAIDEAYGEFARAEGGADAVAALEGLERPWFVLRSFSKAYGLAGARVGYGIGSATTVAEPFHRVRATFNVNAFSLAAAAAAYEDDDYMQARVRECLAERDRMRAALEGRGLRCLPSAGNFLAIALPIPGACAAAALRERGVLVSEIKAPGYERYIRVTAGLRADTDAFLPALAEVLAAQGPVAGPL